MADKRNSKSNALDKLEERIERAQQKVVKTKTAYDEAVKNLKDLVDKRDSIRRDEIASLLINSSRSYDEIVAFLNDSSEQK